MASKSNNGNRIIVTRRSSSPRASDAYKKHMEYLKSLGETMVQEIRDRKLQIDSYGKPLRGLDI